MDTTPDISFVADPWADHSTGKETSAQITSRLGPLLISVCFHSLLLLPVLSLRTLPSQPLDNAPAFQILLRSPQTRSPQTSSTVDSSEPTVQDASSAPEAPAAPAQNTAPVLVPEVSPSHTSPQEPDATLNPVPPSTLELRQIVNQMQQQLDDALPAMFCTPAQQRSAFFDCPDSASDFTDDPKAFENSMPENNSLFNEQRHVRLRTSLLESGLSQEEADRYLERLDVNAQERFTSGDATATRMRDQMLRNDASYQLMQRVFNPP